MDDLERQEREAFEAWVKETRGSPWPIALDRADAGNYMYLPAVEAWAVWQARAALAANVPADLCERICAAINAADDKSMDEANWMLDSNDCIAIVRAQFAAAPAPEADHFPAAGKLVEVAPAQAQQSAEPTPAVMVEVIRALYGEGYLAGQREAKPEAQQPKGLTTERLRQMHHEDEFGLFCDFDEFEQIARAVEQEHSIGASGEASNGNG